MTKRILIYIILFACTGAALPVWGQQALECTYVDQAIVKGDVFFNYGSATDAFSFRNRSSYSLGQPVVGSALSQSYTSYLGFWSRFLIPPLDPTVTASQGELLDRIQLSWEVNPLGAQPTEGFKIYRDGVFLALVDKKTRNFNDFNVIAGRAYKYEVRGINAYGEGCPGSAIGFQVPNGTVTGWVQTINGSPVPDALVALTPLQGFSLKFQPMGGAKAVADTAHTPFLPTAGEDWTMTFWLKTETASANAGVLQLSPYPLYFRALNSAGGHEGVEVANSASGASFVSATFPDSTKNGWHHIALSFDGGPGQGRLYIDGVLASLAPMTQINSADTINLGSRTNTGSWTGCLDELRIYDRRLDELDLGEVMMGTASSLTPGLTHYWKMDEEQGYKAFDVIKRHPLYLCGVSFKLDRPPVRTMGKSNQLGYYRIESASYGTGTTFLAEPMKNFYLHRAIKFVRDEGDYATLPDFSVTPKATLEMWVNSAGPDGEQCLLSKRWPGNEFRLMLKPNGLENEVWFYLNGQQHKFGNLGMNYQHLAFAIDSIGGSSRTVTAYKNGVPFGTPHTFSGITGDWSDTTETWVLGARPSGMSRTDYFGGLIDELALYDTTLAVAKILEHAQNSRNPQERGLRAYFAIDEGSGNRLNNQGSQLTGSGKSFGTTWTPFAPNQSTKPHVFSPNTRQVTLNPSVTSVDQVDFTDRSTVAVSGFVRYKNTDCFAENVEILVNGESYDPPIFTDSTGKFVIDFDPGTTATLTPKFENHLFVPAFWDVTNVVNPIAGILFSDITTRKITGQIAGGLCRKSIISGPAEDCRVTVRTKDGCFEWTQGITDTDGKYEFDPLPPLEVTIAITKHNNPLIYQDFQTQGGRTIDLTHKDSTGVDFIYIAPPSVGVAGFENFYTPCTDAMNNPLPDVDGNPLVVIEEGTTVPLEITVYEQYGPAQNENDRCLLDSAELKIDNTFDLRYNFLEPLDTMMRNKKFSYVFMAAHPNPDPPFLQIMQVTADVAGRKGTFIRKALITGIIEGPQNFTTVSPMVPNFVLRDPPGDGSYAYIEKGTTICNTITAENGGGGGPFFTLELAGGIDKWVDIPLLNTFKLTALAGIKQEFEARIIRTTSSSMDYCLTANERISTDDGDLVVGGETSLDAGKTILPGNDVYVGTAFNFIFSNSRQVSYNDTTCSVQLKDVTSLKSDTFATTYMYSEWNIEYNVIRYLDSLILDGQDPGGINSQAKQRWRDFIAMNKAAKKAATFKRNISWDAGVEYEFSQSRDTSIHRDTSLAQMYSGLTAFTIYNDVSFDPVPAFHFATDIGGKYEGTVVDGSGGDTTKTITVGYVLKDNDPLDTWTMDVKDDPTFKTPVFSVKAGQTSCPWEVGTAQREGVKLISVDGNTRLDVPSNGIASFKFLLNNTSPTGETWTYCVTAGPESNPDGAIVKLNGAPLDHNVFFAIPWGTQLPITITVERGPVAYDYEGLEIVLFSLCHDIRCNALGFAPDFDPVLYSAVYLNVHFNEPCSEVDISFPQDGWVIKPDPINPATQDLLPITVSGYDKNDADLVGIRLQYRPSDGDGAWINITGGIPDYIPKANLGPVFAVYNWNTSGTPPLADGPYEIRAVSVCNGGPTDNPGFSHIIKGRIDREPPSLVGVPQPSDGVYNVGDEISFTFNKPINCDKLIPADITQPNNVGLYDATTGKLIDIDVTCYENKIVIDPNFQNEFFENRILRAELHNIKDKTGNNSSYFKWEFYVDRNELGWLTDSLGLTKFEDQTKTAVAYIHNRGGYPAPFSIQSVPDWVQVVPNKGTLAPNETRAISFVVDSTLGFGRWADTIVLHTETGQNPFFMGGDEGLPFGVRVVCRPPDWNLDNGLYENTMNMVLRLNVQGDVSKDVEDIVAAFINDELRGTAHVQYVPSLNTYLAFLNIYGDPDDMLDTIHLEIWDASECLRYSVLEKFTFQPDNIIGIPNNPQVVHTNNLVLREVPFGYGWNWLSFNLGFPDNSLNAALASLNHPENDLIKSQTTFATYSGGWFGSMTNLGNTGMYIYKADIPDTLKMLGLPLNPATTPIPLVSGWNWVGYIPTYSLPINEALKSVPAQMGDLVRSQDAFAQYISPTFGWIGSLKYMQPPQGYQIRVANPGSLTYPPPLVPVKGEPVEARGESEPTAFWTVTPTQYEHTMTLIGMLSADGKNASTASMELGAFAGNEVRGAAQAIYVAPLQAYLFFLTTYANTSGEPLQFKLFDSSTGLVQGLKETMYFAPNLHQGSIEAPVPFTLLSTGTVDAEAKQSFEVQPNPFERETALRFVLPKAEEVTLTITDAAGREVSVVRQEARAGLNVVSWDGRSDTGQWLGSGVYVVRLQTEAGSVSRKVVLQRLP